MIAPWDRIVVINLPHRTDKLADFKASLATSTLCSSLPLTVFPAYGPDDVVRPTWFWPEYEWVAHRYWACKESHMRVWEECLLAGVEHVLIFEDDAKLWPDFDERFERFWRHLPADWMGYQLGGCWWADDQPVNEGCRRMTGQGCLHAYGMTSAGLQRAYDHLKWHRTAHVDRATATLHAEEPHFYMPLDWFVGTRPSVSDNTGAWTHGHT